MPSGENAVKGQQGFQATRRPAADLAGVQVGDIQADGADEAALQERLATLTGLRDRLTADISQASTKLLALQVRRRWPTAARIAIDRDEPGGAYEVDSIIDADGRDLAHWQDDYEAISELRDATAAIDARSDGYFPLLDTPIEPRGGGRLIDTVSVDRALSINPANDIAES